MKALTVRQPYADAIAHGSKPVENRTRPLPPKYAGVPVLLHAAKDPHATGITATDLAEFTGADITAWADTRSAILAQIRFRGSHLSTEEHWCCRPWGQVPTRIQPVVWHWEIDQVILLDRPVSATGALGFWNVTDDDLAAVRRQINLESKETTA